MKRPDLKLLKQTFRKYPEIQAVYLFGSAASGKVHHRSDLDLAVISRTKDLHGKKLDILEDLARLGFCDVDLVFLDQLDIIVQFEAVRRNVLLYRVPEFDRGAAYSNIVRRYLDFYPYLSVQRAAYRKRILDDRI